MPTQEESASTKRQRRKQSLMESCFHNRAAPLPKSAVSVARTRGCRERKPSLLRLLHPLKVSTSRSSSLPFSFVSHSCIVFELRVSSFGCLCLGVVKQPLSPGSLVCMTLGCTSIFRSLCALVWRARAGLELRLRHNTDLSHRLSVHLLDRHSLLPFHWLCGSCRGGASCSAYQTTWQASPGLLSCTHHHSLQCDALRLTHGSRSSSSYLAQVFQVVIGFVRASEFIAWLYERAHAARVGSTLSFLLRSSVLCRSLPSSTALVCTCSSSG